MAQGPSDEEQIRGLVKLYVDAGNRGDVETAVSIMADDFMTEDGMDKEDMTFQLEDAIAAGTEFEATEVEIKIAPDGKNATVSGVSVDYTPYVATLEKRAGKWLVTSVAEDY
jgi:ketosteroid isomerase-like protein